MFFIQLLDNGSIDVDYGFIGEIRRYRDMVSALVGIYNFSSDINNFLKVGLFIFTYSLLKGLAGGADDGDNVIELGELTEYVYRMVPELARIVPHSGRQNPSFNGMDLKRTILDLR